MKAAALIACGLAIAGLWVWAATTRVEAEPLPERLCGLYQVFRIETPEGTRWADTSRPGRTHRYEFRPDGTYRMSILVSGGWEMVRAEGIATLDRRQVLTLRRLSMNRRESPAEPEHLGTRWGRDEGGEFLVLRHVGAGHSVFLRRVEDEPSSGR